MDRYTATRRLQRLADTAGIRVTRTHPHMLRHTFVPTMLDASVDLRISGILQAAFSATCLIFSTGTGAVRPIQPPL